MKLLFHASAKVEQSARVHERYKQWAADNNLRKLSGTAFGPQMKRTYRQHRNSQGTYYLGISLKP